jgi:hypothetical protein
MKELENNPHVLQMIEELVNDPALLKRVEAGDMDAVKEASERAKEHFLMITCGIYGVRYRQDVLDAIIHEMSLRVYSRIRSANNAD